MINDEHVGAITKTLSSNDTGETGSHQAGTHIPKSGSIPSFFPHLNKLEKNPRVTLYFEGLQNIKWRFSFIYYNNSFYGGTRNEYRLTGMTKYFRKYDLKTGDRLTLYRNEQNEYSIEHTKRDEQPDNVLYLGNTWREIHIK